MKFKDIDLENDYFGHGTWEEQTVIYKYDKDMDVMIINNCIGGHMDCIDNRMSRKNFIKLEDIYFFANQIMHSNDWFVLKKIQKINGIDFDNIETTWEMWR